MALGSLVTKLRRILLTLYLIGLGNNASFLRADLSKINAIVYRCIPLIEIDQGLQERSRIDIVSGKDDCASGLF